MNTRFHSGTVIALAIAMMTLLAGCGADEPVATNAATVEVGTASLPTFAEIQAAVSFDDADAAVVKGALADWRQAQAGDQTQTRRGNVFRHEMAFIAAIAPSLDNAQLEKLVNFLVERRDARRDAMRDRDRDRDRRHGGDFYDRLVEALGLTAEQQAAMKALHDETRAKAQEQHAAFRAGTITREQLHEAMQAIHESRREKMAAILTPAQLATLDELRDQRQDRHLDRRTERFEHMNGTHVEWLTAVLGLDQAQKTQVAAAVATLATAHKSVLEALKNDTITREAAREQRGAARDAFETALEGILTAEQWERYQIVQRLRGPRLS